MAIQNGWHYVKGPIYGMIWSDVSSTATFKAFNPVCIGSKGYAVAEALDSDVTAIYGIAQNDAADSLPGIGAGKTLVLVPTEKTVFSIKVGTGAPASELSVGQAFDIEKSGNYIIGNEDSATTPFVVIVPRDDWSTIDSTDSSVYVNILGNRIGPIGSNASGAINV